MPLQWPEARGPLSAQTRSIPIRSRAPRSSGLRSGCGPAVRARARKDIVKRKIGQN